MWEMQKVYTYCICLIQFANDTLCIVVCTFAHQCKCANISKINKSKDPFLKRRSQWYWQLVFSEEVTFTSPQSQAFDHCHYMWDTDSGTASSKDTNTEAMHHPLPVFQTCRSETVRRSSGSPTVCVLSDTATSYLPVLCSLQSGSDR